jgi:hypothetical protein
MILRGLPERLLGKVSFSLIVSFNPLKSPKNPIIYKSLIINRLSIILIYMCNLLIINQTFYKKTTK